MKLDEKEWLTTGEVATMCGMTAQTVRRWVNCGKLNAVRFNEQRRIKRVDVEAFIKAAESRGVYAPVDGYARTAGPATSGSWKTWWSAPWCRRAPA